MTGLLFLNPARLSQQRSKVFDAASLRSFNLLWRILYKANIFFLKLVDDHTVLSLRNRPFLILVTDFTGRQRRRIPSAL